MPVLGKDSIGQSYQMFEEQETNFSFAPSAMLMMERNPVVTLVDQSYAQSFVNIHDGVEFHTPSSHGPELYIDGRMPTDSVCLAIPKPKSSPAKRL